MFQLTQTVTLLLAAGAALASPQYGLENFKRTPAAPAVNGIQFDCSLFPAVCQNMCWGAFCVDKHSDMLIYDKASSKIVKARRKAAGCIDDQKPGNNRCSKGRPNAKPGYNCDEYPFASSKTDSAKAGTNGQENRCSRCVPSKENSKQGSVLAKGYGKKGFCKGNVPCAFQVFFTKTTNVKHCNVKDNNNCQSPDDEKCSNPISIIQRDVTTRDSLGSDAALINGTFVPGPAEFRTYSGVVLAAPHGGYIGQEIHNVVPINGTLWEQQTEEHEQDLEQGHEQYHYMTENLDIEIDWIKEVV